MANNTRQSFRPSQTGSIELPTGDLPERVTIDLDDKDPNNIQVVEVDDRTEDEREHGTSDPANWNEANNEDPKGAGPRVEKRINRLKAEAEAQRRLTEAATRERDAAIEAARVHAAEVADLKARLSSGTTALATSMKAEREARVADAERRLAQAHADGDSAAIAAATKDMGAAQSELAQIVANAPRPQTQQPQQQTQQPAPQQQQQRPPEIKPNVAAWISHNNDWFGKDRTKTDFAMSVHRAIIGRGIRDDSPEYTQELDKGLKAVYPEHQPYSGSSPGNGNEGGGNPQPRRTNAVAEGSRETARQPNPRIVELTASQLAIAKRLGLKPQQYAASLVKYDKQNGAS
jgi:hypothetical protein